MVKSMPKTLYQWKRFWCPREGSMNLSDGGYLYNPDSEWGHIINKDIVSFEKISDTPCLVLLGEPGIGKSIAMQAERISIEEKIEEEGNKTFWLDLRSYGNEQRLVQKLFESPEVIRWKEKSYDLYIFLDSFDECLLRIETVASILAEELRDLPVERLRLRIACRTFEWPASLENNLLSLWGKDSLGVYELVPLRRKDVIEAAKSNSIEPTEFISEIDKMEAVSLAIKPVTLGFLVNLFKKNGKFPNSKTALYLQGCELLCEDPSPNLRETNQTGKFDSRQRLAVASRIAAATIFSNKFAVWTSVDCGDVPEDDIPINELSGGTESVGGIKFNVNLNAVKETLSTGLFNARGQYRLGWSHQTYAEFLAAYYLSTKRMKTDNIKSLIYHSEDPLNKLVPQLSEVSSWLSDMIPDIFDSIIENDPGVLLKSDLSSKDDIYKEKLVEKLLNAYEKMEILEKAHEMETYFAKLAHKSLANQLLPFIKNDKKVVYVRKIVFKIAAMCNLRDLQDDIVGVIFDDEENLPIKIEAARCILTLGDNDTKMRLKALLSEKYMKDDIDDQLRGLALMSLWPENISAQELFAHIQLPKKDNFVGAYHMFLSYNVSEHLNVEDLPVGLEWVAQQDDRYQLHTAFERLSDSIMRKAWGNTNEPGVLLAFAKAALGRLKHHDEIIKKEPDKPSAFQDDITKNDEKRRNLAKAIIGLTSDQKEGYWHLLSFNSPIVFKRDLFWLIENLKTCGSETEQHTWSWLIEKMIDFKDPAQVNAVLDCCQKVPVLAEEMKRHIAPVQFDSPEAEEMKGRHEKIQKMLERQEKRELLDPPPKESIEELLVKIEQGEYDAWWLLNREMTLKPDSTHYGDGLEYDLTALSGWSEAEETTKSRIIESAKLYLLNKDCNKEKWLGKNIIYRPAEAGYRAFLLLMKFHFDFIESLDRTVWERWAPIILECSDDSSENQEIVDRLFAIAYEKARSEVLISLTKIIEKESRDLGHIFVTRKVDKVWDDAIKDTLLLELKGRELKPADFETLLDALLSHDVQEAKEIAKSLVANIGSKEANVEFSIVAAQALMRYCDSISWKTVWKAIKADNEFGKKVIEGYSHMNRHSARMLENLTEPQLSELFVWLVKEYPYSSERVSSGMGFYGPADSASDFKRDVLNHLVSRGTFEACNAIRKIMKEFPELDWLKWTLLEALDTARRKTWKPLSVSELFKFAGDAETRLVQNGTQLIEVLIESLERLEKKLQGETPAAVDLWNVVAGKYSPKDEEAFSNYVKRHLDDDIGKRGIIVNREVEIRRGEGEGKGERTDIHVNALTQISDDQTYDSITSIIEVKGCWNKKLKKDMEDQLKNRYMKDNACNHGLYLVGWFNCEQWDDGDYRKKDSPKIGIGQARDLFKDQASALSNGEEIDSFVMNCAVR